MNTNRQRLRYSLATLATLLTCAAGIHANEQATSFFRFVGQTLRELSPSGVQNALSEPSLYHAVDVQILHCNELMLADDFLAGVMGKVRPQVGYPFIDSLEPVHGLAEVAAPLDLAAHFAMGVSEFPFCFAGESRVVNGVPVAHGRERLQPHVDADAGMDRNRLWDLAMIVYDQLGEPLASPPHNVKLLDRALGVLHVAGLDRAVHAGYADAFATHALAGRLNREAIPALPRLESGKARLALAFADSSKKVLKRKVQTTKGVAFDFRGHVGECRHNRPQDRQVGGLRHVGQRGFVGFVGDDTLFERGVEQLASDIEKMLQAGLLSGRRIQAGGHRSQHAIMLPKHH